MRPSIVYDRFLLYFSGTLLSKWSMLPRRTRNYPTAVSDRVLTIRLSEMMPMRNIFQQSCILPEKARTSSYFPSYMQSSSMIQLYTRCVGWNSEDRVPLPVYSPCCFSLPQNRLIVRYCAIQTSYCSWQ